jgi:chromosomal replication initiation ATPase DnaA
MGLKRWNAQNCSDFLKRFGGDPDTSRINYELYLNKAVENKMGKNFITTMNTLKKTNNKLEDKKDTSCWVIGNHEYIKQVLNQQEQLKIRLSKAVRENISIDSIAEEVCKKLEIEKSKIFIKGRNNMKSYARKIISYLAHRKYEIPVSLLAEYFNITSPGVSNMLEIGERLYRKYY